MQPQENVPTARAPTVPNESVVGSSSCCLHWPPLLHVYLQPAPATTEVLGAISHSQMCTYHWTRPSLLLALVLADGPGGTTDDPKSPCNHYEPPEVLTKDDTVINAVDPRSLSQRDITLPWARYHHKPLHLELCAIRPGVTACSSMPPPTKESIPLPKSVHKVWKKQCFSRGADTYANLYFFIYYCSPKTMFYTNFCGALC